MDWANSCVLQRHDFGLGNFINLTPAIQALSRHFGRKIPVHFELEHVKDAFVNCPFIEIVEKREHIILGSNSVNQYIADWLFNLSKVSCMFGFETENIHTYVDSYIPLIKNYGVIIRGSGETPKSVKGYTESKDPGNEIYNHILKTDKKIFWCGSENDFNRWDMEVAKVSGITNVLKIINGADWVVANDSGLYHCAAALKKKLLVLWKDTNFEKNKAPYGTYSLSDHITNFDKWVK